MTMANIRDVNDETQWNTTGACLGQALALNHAWINWQLLDRIAELQQRILPGAFVGVSFESSTSRYRAAVQRGPADGVIGHGATEHFARVAAIVRGQRDIILAKCEKSVCR